MGVLFLFFFGFDLCSRSSLSFGFCINFDIYRYIHSVSLCQCVLYLSSINRGFGLKENNEEF